MPILCFRAIVGEVVQQGKRMGLASTKLRGHVEHGRGLGFLPGQSAKHFGGNAGQPFREEGTLQKALRVLIDSRGAPVPNLIEVNGKLRCIERFAVS